MKTKSIFAADIGGTNSRFAHFLAHPDGSLVLEHTHWLTTKTARGLFHLLEQLRETDFTLKPEEADCCVFAVAGPVEDGVRSAPPNIDWTIDLSDPAARAGIKSFRLINDFLAQAYACLSPLGSSAKQIVLGTRAPRATIGVIGAGTGLGKAALVLDESGRYVGMPSEGGHAAFPLEREDELPFLAFAKEKLDASYVTYEHVVSGKGLSLIHSFLTGVDLSPQEVAEAFEANPKTLGLAARWYGRACRNFGLEVLSRGGIFIAGGVAAKNPRLVHHEEFLTEFRLSEKQKHVMAEMPVFLIENQESGLWGAAYCGLQAIS